MRALRTFMPRTTTKRRKVFISHAPGDDSLARHLAKKLRAERFETFLESENLEPGDNGPLLIGKALADSDVIVLLLSPGSLRSSIPEMVWSFAVFSKKHAHRVLPVLTPGTPEDAVPWIVRRIEHVRSGDDWESTVKKVASVLARMAGAA